jgi:hypothetical protein
LARRRFIVPEKNSLSFLPENGTIAFPEMAVGSFFYLGFMQLVVEYK